MSRAAFSCWQRIESWQSDRDESGSPAYRLVRGFMKIKGSAAAGSNLKKGWLPAKLSAAEGVQLLF